MIGVVEARVRELRAAVEARSPQHSSGGSDALKSGEALTVRWQASEKLPGRPPAHLVLAIPGDVRFETASVELRRDTYGVLLPALPGFLALPAGTHAPLGIQFGADKTRALIPLHQPGSQLSGSFSIGIFDSGPHVLGAALVARTQCGECQLTDDLGRTISVAPGDPEILVQDPYDIELPKSVLVSNSGRYLAQIFDGRYRVFDIATGVKLVDRNGYVPNFSPAVLNGEQGTPQIFELATGHIGCCQSPDEVAHSLSANYGLDGFAFRKGWHAGEPIAFTHVFDPLNHPGRKWWDAAAEQEDWHRTALALRKQLAVHRQINPDLQEQLFADGAKGATSRGHWLERGWWKDLKQWWTGGAVARMVDDRLRTEPNRFGITTMETVSREEIRSRISVFGTIR